MKNLLIYFVQMYQNGIKCYVLVPKKLVDYESTRLPHKKLQSIKVNSSYFKWWSKVPTDFAS